MADEPETEITDKPRRLTRAERWAIVHERAMLRFDAIWSVVREERLQNISDRRFATIRGAQWEGQYAFGDTSSGDDEHDQSVAQQDTGLPRMEVPKIHKSLIRIYSEYRSNRITVDFRPRGQASDESTSDALDGLYRADENDTRGGGQAAYDNAFDEGIAGGFGAWRYRADYEDDSDEDNNRQRIRIEPVYDADQSVFFDLDAKHQDKSDARFAFVLHTMSPDAFREKHPDADETTFGGKLDWNYDWVTPDVITVAEYYEVEDKSLLRRTFRNIGTDEERTEDDADLKAERDIGGTLERELLASGWEEVRSRRIKRQRVRKYLLSGAEVLEGGNVIAGPNIPIVPFYGKRWYIDGIERAMGHTRLAIDATRIYNMMVSSMVEAAAASPFARPIFDPEQVQGLEDTWARANIDRAPYSLARVLYGPDDKPIQIGAIGTVEPPSVAPNVAALIQVAGNDIADLTGEAEQAETVPANTSAQAIELVHDRADMRTFVYTDNLRKAMQRGGEIWLGMASELYVEEGREMVSIDKEGGQTTVTLGEPTIEQSGRQILLNDLTTGRYEVVVDVGPATRTKRDATVKAMFGIAQMAGTLGDNDTGQAALNVAILNLDGEGMDDFQKWKRQQAIRAGYVQPNEQEAAQLEAEAQNAQPDPQQQLVMAAAQQALAEAEAAQSRSIEAQARAEQAKAKTAEILAGIGQKERDQALAAVRVLMDMGGQRFDQMNKVLQNERQEVPNGDAA